MQTTTQDAERKFRLNVRLGNKKVRTKLEYTMEQAEEIDGLVTESARQALECDEVIPLRDRSKSK